MLQVSQHEDVALEARTSSSATRLDNAVSTELDTRYGTSGAAIPPPRYVGLIVDEVRQELRRERMAHTVRIREDTLLDILRVYLENGERLTTRPELERVSPSWRT